MAAGKICSLCLHHGRLLSWWRWKRTRKVPTNNNPTKEREIIIIKKPRFASSLIFCSSEDCKGKINADPARGDQGTAQVCGKI